MNGEKLGIEGINLKILRLKYESRSVQYTMSERMRKKRQMKQLEKERDEWKTQNVS